MKTPCIGCIHNNVCRSRHIMETITASVDAALDHIEATIEDKACSIKDIPWLKVDRMVLVCKNYCEDKSYQMAMQIAQSNRNALTCAPCYTQPCI